MARAARKSKSFNRSMEDTGNVVGLEHVNIRVPDQRLATLFYITGLGLTRDPYLVTGVVNMWVNIGRSQFHLPTGEAQVLRGRVGLVLPDLDAALERLEQVRKPLDGTKFDLKRRNNGHGSADVICPWGNRIRLHRPASQFGPMALGMPYVEFTVPAGSADGIARFYSQVLGAPTMVKKTGASKAAHVTVGQGQSLIYRETKGAIPDYDGHHIQVYVANFSGPHAALKKQKLVSEESDQYQYRFKDIFDPKTGKVLYRLEHEVRSMTHPLYARPLVNRNPAQTNQAYAPGHEARPWAEPYNS